MPAPERREEVAVKRVPIGDGRVMYQKEEPVTPCTITGMSSGDGRLLLVYSCGTLAEALGEADSDTVRVPCPEHPPKVERCSCEEASLYAAALREIAAGGCEYADDSTIGPCPEDIENPCRPCVAARALEGVGE